MLHISLMRRTDAKSSAVRGKSFVREPTVFPVFSGLSGNAAGRILDAMARRKRDREIDGAEIAVQLALVCLGTVVVASVTLGLGTLFSSVLSITLTLISLSAGLVVLFFAGRAMYRKSAEARSRPPFRPAGWTPPVFPRTPSDGTPFPMLSAEAPPAMAMRVWTPTTVRTALDDIDWFQFERFCAALLRTEDYEVVRKGSARPDGGVDLTAEKDGERVLVQCKHWRTWTVNENVVRETLAGMAQYTASRGAIYTLKGWTVRAAHFAAANAITLVDAEELARRAAERLTAKHLSEILNPDLPHCPKCEATMVWRTGNFRSFWGCSTFPRCRGTLKYTGAR